MRSKTTSFNKGIYFFNLRRFWLIAFAFAFLLTVSILDFLNYASESTWGEYAIYTPDEVAREIFAHTDILATVLFPLFSLISALALFSYIHNQRSTAMIHALPVTRGSLFITHYLSGLTLVLLPLLISGAILIAGELLMGITHIGYSLLWILVSAVFLFLFYSFAVFTGMFTGHMAAHALFFLIFNFLAVFLQNVIELVLSSMLFGYTSPSSSPVQAFSPIVYFYDLFPDFSNGTGDYAAVVCYLAAGLVFAWGAYAIYRKRHMESAGDVISLKIMKPVFKYSVAFCSSALLGSIIVSFMNFGRGFWVFVISYLIGGFIGYFAAEMLLKKTFRVFMAKQVKGFLVFSLVIVLLLCGIRFDLFGYETYIPDPRDVEIMFVDNYADELAEIALVPENYNPDRHWYMFVDVDKRENAPDKLDENMIRNLRQRPGIIEKPETVEKAVALHRTIIQNASALDFGNPENRFADEDARYFNFCFAYRLKSGRIVERAYYIPYIPGSGGELESSLDELLASTEFMEKAYPLLTVEADDLSLIQIMFYDAGNTILNLTDHEEMEAFLKAYQADLKSSAPMNILLNYTEGDSTGIEITFTFKSPTFLVPNGIMPLSGTSLTTRLSSGYRNTLAYLAGRTSFDEKTWQQLTNY